MAGELLEKEEKGLFLGQSSSFGGGVGKQWQGFYPADDLTSIDQELPD